MIQLTPIFSRYNINWFKSKNVKKLAFNPQLQTVQTLTNDVQMLIFCLSYFITTVIEAPLKKRIIMSVRWIVQFLTHGYKIN